MKNKIDLTDPSLKPIINSIRKKMYMALDVTLDSYSETNRVSGAAIGDGTNDGWAQSFKLTADAPLATVTWELEKVGTPTGNCVAKLYNHDGGTYGDNGEPIGQPISVSALLDVSTLTGTPTLTDFDFSNPFILLADVAYYVSIEFFGGDGTNHITVSIDTTTPTHDGGRAWRISGGDDGDWIGSSTADLCFYIKGHTIYQNRISDIGMEPLFSNVDTPADTDPFNS